MKMIKKISWKKFKSTGLLLIINQILHIFGLAIVFKIDKGKVIDVYPARVKFRGFDSKSVSKSYIRVTEYLKENIPILLEESKE